jgi:integrase
MDCQRLFLIGPINLDLEGIEFDPQAGRGPIRGDRVTIGFDFDLAVAIEPDRHFPAAVKATLVSARLRQLGKKAQVEPVSPPRLWHTLATLLVNQGMPITSLQKFLGHQDLDTTLIYARVFDETVRQQFAAAMAQIEAVAVAD